MLLSHPTANNFVRHLAYAMASNNLLHSFHTSVATFENDWYYPLVQFPAFKDLKRRSFELQVKSHTHTYPLKESVRLVSNKFPIPGVRNYLKNWASVDSVYSYLDNKVAEYLNLLGKESLPSWVYCPEDGAYSTFKMAKQRGIACGYDLPIAYWKVLKELMLEELERWPTWKETMGGGISDSEKKLEKKDKELFLADTIIVPSKFVLDSLPEWASSKKIILSPFGTPSSEFEVPTTTSIPNNKLRVLFVGSLTQRKGLADLFSAFKLLKDKSGFELVILGKPLTDHSFYKNQGLEFVYEESRPNHEVLALMRTCHVFCLPSIVEGRALVLQEAMSQGLPLLITPNTGGEDLIDEGKTGFLVPIRSPEIIAGKLQWFKDNSDQWPMMSECSKFKARNITWKNYTDLIINGTIGNT